MNPFRDRSPEIAAERFMTELGNGNFALLNIVDADERQRLIQNEKKWPLRNWRIGRRIDSTHETELMYWVRRGNGYSDDGYEEEVYVKTRLTGQRYSVVGFAAVY
jgi:hypothetical protein